MFLIELQGNQKEFRISKPRKDLMIAVGAMTMFCLAAKFPIHIISKYDENGGWNDQPNYIVSKKMFYS